jgi:transposase InsO family protein
VAPWLATPVPISSSGHHICRSVTILSARRVPVAVSGNDWPCYRLLKAHDLITSPAYVVIKAADRFHTQTTRPNEMWQTDFTYFKIIGWGWVYLSTVLD